MGLLEEIIFYDVTALLSTLQWHALNIWRHSYYTFLNIHKEYGYLKVNN